jgi:hypothetical protein
VPQKGFQTGGWRGPRATPVITRSGHWRAAAWSGALGPPEAPRPLSRRSTSPVGSDAHAALRNVEVALSSLDLGADPGVEAQPWPELKREVNRLNQVLRVNADYAAQGQVVPALLTQLHTAYVQRPDNRGDMLVGLIHAYHSAAVLTKNQGVRGYPVMAARLAEQCAQELGSPKCLGFAAWLGARGLAGPSASVLAVREYSLFVRGIDPTWRVSGRPGRAAGRRDGLHLNEALAAAAQSDGDTAISTTWPRPRASRDGCRNVGRTSNICTSGRTTSASGASARGWGPKVAELARGVRPDALPAKARQGACSGSTSAGR